MFWKKKSEDDYDDYNESINEKYDDDYIRQVEEYREECSHSHEQTYENYDSRQESTECREECTHSHEQTYANEDSEQTYEDFDSEQRPYDELNETEKKFTKYLDQGEYIIWCGKAEKDADATETGMGCLPAAGKWIIVAAALTVILFGCLSIAVIVMMVILMDKANVKKREYAITNKRFMELNKGAYRCIPLSAIKNANYKCSQRNIGYIMFVRTDRPQPAGKNYKQFTDGIFAIKDPANVCNILNNAIIGNRIN